MLPYEINGLPLHILLVHVVVIVVPAGAILTALGAVWPAFRRKVGILTPIVTLIGLVSVPLATNAGEWLQERIASTPLVLAHVALGETMLPWAVAQFVVATVIWAWYRFFAAVRRTPEPPQRNASVPVPAGAAAGGSGTSGAEASPAYASADPFAPAATPDAEDHEPSLTPPNRASAQVSAIVSIVLIVAGLGISAGTVMKVVQIGESGSQAVWSGSFSDQPR
ncbi:MAG: hypothetical protein JWQ64_1903 [Subtercola sp.]|jgi:hypothetical protein|nr:hypothetical protein [Subtercola sp.]